MFTSDVVEAGQQEITMQGIDGEALKTIVSYMYSGKSVICIDVSYVIDNYN